MIPNNNVVCEDVTHIRHFRHLRWSAIIAGAFVALGLGFLLQLFGLAIGLSAYHSDAGSNTLAIGGVLGLIVGIIVAMGVAGFVSGYYAKFCDYFPGESFLYGFLTWSIALLLSALLIMPLTHYVSSYNDGLAPQLKVSSNMPAQVMVTHKPTSDNPAPAEQTEVKMTPSMLKGSSWLVFILFFIGAVSSCVGASCGMNCKLKHRDPVLGPRV